MASSSGLILPSLKNLCCGHLSWGKLPLKWTPPCKPAGTAAGVLLELDEGSGTGCETMEMSRSGC